MFRASDIFGRRPGSVPDRPKLEVKAETAEKRGPTSRTWDPATGKWVEEELPAEVQELMGLKRARTDPRLEAAGYEPPRLPRVLGPGTVGLAPQASASSVQYRGFSKAELNDRYHEKSSVVVNGRPTYWTRDGQLFLYWQGQAFRRWAICDTSSLQAVQNGLAPGWAYRNDAQHFAAPGSWMEAHGRDWRPANVSCSAFDLAPQAAASGTGLGPVKAENAPLAVEYRGFGKAELNDRYSEKRSVLVNGRPTYWTDSAEFFVYWQGQLFRRWAICDKTSLQAVQAGEAPGWAYRSDSQHFATSSGWMEVVGRAWRPASVTCTVLQGTVQEEGAAAKAEEPVPQLSVEQYHALIRRVYEEKNPSKLDNLEALLKKYEGQEEYLFSQVCERYQADAHALIADLLAKGTQAAKEEDDDEYAHLGNTEVPALSAAEYAVLIQSVYERHNPKKLQDLGRLLHKYRMRERELYLEVCYKYSVHPAKFHARMQKEQPGAAQPV